MDCLGISVDMTRLKKYIAIDKKNMSRMYFTARKVKAKQFQTEVTH